MRPLAWAFVLLALVAMATGRLGWAFALELRNAEPPTATVANLDQRAGAPAVSRAEAEEAAWRETRRENLPESYANFLYLYADGRYAKDAFRSLVRVADPVGGRVTDVPLVGAARPFSLDAFFALHVQRRGKPMKVTEALVRSPSGKALLGSLAELAEDPDPAVRLAALDLLASFDELWWFRLLPPQTKRRLEEAVLPGLQGLLREKQSSLPAGVAYVLWELNRTRAAEPLLERLASGKPQARRAAADVLGLVGGAAAVEPLAAALRNEEDQQVRTETAESMGEIGDPRAIAALAAALRDDRQEEVRVAAAIALRAIGSAPAIEPLTGALKADKSPTVRWTAACALGTLGDAQTVPALAAALKDEDKSVRRAAAETLGALRDPRAVEPLLALLAAENAEPLRAATIDALGTIGDPRAVEPLVVLIEREKSDQMQPAGMAAALALRTIGDARAIKFLFSALDGKDTQSRSRAAVALGILDGTPKALSLLAREHRWRWFYHEAAWPGRRMFDPRSVHRLIAALREEGADLRQSAATALGITGDARAVEPLVAALKRDREARVREAAVRALGMIDDRPPVDALVSALQDDSRRVVLRAVEVLREVKDPRVPEALAAALKRLKPPAAIPHTAAPNEDPLATQELVHKGLLTALGATRDARALDPLAASLEHKSPQVREAAAQALGMLRSPRAVAALLAALRDESSWVREKSATALGMIGDPRAVEPLLAILEDQAPEVRDAALRALPLLNPQHTGLPVAERLLAVRVATRYRTSYWTALFSLGWRPLAPGDSIRLLAAQDQRVLLLALWPTTKQVLLADAAAGDAGTAQRIAELLIVLGKDEITGDLVSWLKTKGTKNLAAVYFHSGKKELREAAVAWAKERGKVELPARPADNDVQWGAM